MRFAIYVVIAGIPCIVLYEFVSGRLFTRGLVGGTRRTDDPHRYWTYMVWQVLVWMIAVWFATTPYFAQLRE
ncbi:MAG TPA: hypothetical protein VK728_11770 [Candidatus Sulfotelmatobacter sp.]|jgi:hypothetical protein|nr:hypothetical protein [Candidatus Sulfotelmatobacter sp.]